MGVEGRQKVLTGVHFQNVTITTFTMNFGGTISLFTDGYFTPAQIFKEPDVLHA
jgi:ABC-type multidrug transport system permease subunit